MCVHSGSVEANVPLPPYILSSEQIQGCVSGTPRHSPYQGANKHSSVNSGLNGTIQPPTPAANQNLRRCLEETVRWLLCFQAVSTCCILQFKLLYYNILYSIILLVCFIMPCYIRQCIVAFGLQTEETLSAMPEASLMEPVSSLGSFRAFLVIPCFCPCCNASPHAIGCLERSCNLRTERVCVIGALADFEEPVA